MRLNTTKCKVISYVPKSASPLEPILLNNNQLEVVNMHKYISINLTPNLDNDQQLVRVSNIIKSAPYLLH